MHFGENQLSPLSIGISPLPTRHPSGLQSTPVRASMTCYGHFTLHMGSSSGFGSTMSDIHALFRLAFAVAPASHCLNRPLTVTRRIILQKARCQATVQARSSPTTARTQTGSGSISLPSPGCFSPFPHGTVRYRSLGVACLGEWAPQLHTTLPVCGATQEQRAASRTIHLPGYHGLWRGVPNRFDFVWQVTVVNDSSPDVVLQPRALKACQLGTWSV